MIKASLFVLLGGCALAACVADGTPDVDPDPDPAADVDPIARSCAPWGCLQNTALGPGDEIFDELDASRTSPNAHGIQIDTFKSRGDVPLQVVIERDHLVGIDAFGTRYEGAALNNSVMSFKYNGLPAFEAVFNLSTVPTQFWGGDTTQLAITYEISVRRIGDPPTWVKPACRNDPPSPNEWFGSPTSAVIYAGDRYFDEKHTVRDSVGTSWFNIACAGGYPAKLHLLRHTYAGGFGSDGIQHWPTRITARQTYLRAIVADYAGDGSVWTHTGVPLYYGDSKGVYPARLDGTREAVWNQYGAVCMDRTRLGDAVVPRAWFWPSVPDCPSGPWPSDDWKALGYVITVIP